MEKYQEKKLTSQFKILQPKQYQNFAKKYFFAILPFAKD